MLLDGETRLSSKQAINGNGTSTDNYDAKQDRNIGVGEPMGISIDTHAVAGSSGTVEAQVQTADNSSFTTNPEVLTTIDVSKDGSNSRKIFILPKDARVGRFIRIRYSRASGNRTVNVSASLLHASGIPARPTYYPRGYKVE